MKLNKEQIKALSGKIHEGIIEKIENQNKEANKKIEATKEYKKYQELVKSRDKYNLDIEKIEESISKAEKEVEKKYKVSIDYDGKILFDNLLRAPSQRTITDDLVISSINIEQAGVDVNTIINTLIKKYTK